MFIIIPLTARLTALRHTERVASLADLKIGLYSYKSKSSLYSLEAEFCTVKLKIPLNDF